MGVKLADNGRVNWKSVGVGTAVAVIVTLLLAAAIGFFEYNEVIGEETVEKFCCAVQVISVMIGCVISCRKGRGGAAPVLAVIYCAILGGITALFFEGDFGHVPLSMLMIAAGTSVVMLMNMSGKKQSKRFKRKGYSR